MINTPARPKNFGTRTTAPTSQGSAAARQVLRILALNLVQRIDAEDADLWTLAMQCEQAGALAIAELDNTDLAGRR
jgi:hypothetical protein